MRIAIIGLGKMGNQIARKLHEAGHSVVVNDHKASSVDEMKALGMTAGYTREEIIKAFGKDQVIIWMMIPADVVDSELTEWLKLIPKGSILIDFCNRSRGSRVGHQV